MSTWVVATGQIKRIVRAKDQWEAWDTLRAEDRCQFGLIATAEENESGDDEAIPVKTSALMERWGRINDAQAFHALAHEKGLE